MFILGSASPRRVEILHYFSLPFVQKPSSFDETSIEKKGLKPCEYCQTLALEKAKVLKDSYPKETILTADTIVYTDQILEKPLDQKKAFEMVKTIQGRSHTVYTALSLFHMEKFYNHVESTKVFIEPLSDLEIENYITKLHCLDKAGSYFIQEKGSLIVEKIEGCFYNVMGLPIHALKKLLKQANINLWDYL